MQEAITDMAGNPRMRNFAMLLAIVAVIVACTTFPGPSPTQTVCDGVSSELGGCTAQRHAFVGSTCQDLAREWAGVLDGALVAILDGPEAVESQSRSVLIKQALVITTIDMQTRLAELGLAETCDLPEFMAAAEPLFSDRLRTGAGGALYDGNPPATYSEWLDDVRSTVRMIDDGE